ncbi:hypothetical protein ACNI3T_00605 [Christiangramia sp. ASW11-125]|uniref:hypothetical protein n=1 Tax=Christiangramia sp. ASW11-125 TaxID=3400701 RepID=UPI003AAAC35B
MNSSKTLLKYVLLIIFTIYILSCKHDNKSEIYDVTNENIGEYKKLIFPDTIYKNSIFGKLEYYYELPDSLIPNENDYGTMTVYAQLTKKRKNPSEIVLKEVDSFFAERDDFNDTLKSPIFFITKKMKGEYYLSGRAIIKSLPANNGRKDTISDLTMYIREFAFELPNPISINE